MYKVFYRFREKPFHVTADPTFLYLSRQHQEALNHLTYGIRERLGFLMITGEVGTGKTTLAKTLIEKLPSSAKTALILHPTLSSAQLLRAVLKDFGVPPSGSSRAQLLQAIEIFLLEQAASGGEAVLVVDEAQALSSSTLEQVRLLSNVETPKRKLLQIVLIGQPELTERLDKDPRLRALHQRIAVRYQIQPLAEEEVASYIDHRIQIAGEKGIPLFTPGAMAKIAEISQGIPRRINRICDQALLAGFVRESRTIDESMVEQALSTLTNEKRRREEIPLN
ncbi:MAG: AAA family ATPase [Candidatus Omnitrophica bacterium]|nr:AAA family ATPase [Candidatus Omnitrophota bacterium]